MGDRANIYVVQHDGDTKTGIYIYTHWSGDDLPVTLRDALKRGRKRWEDEPYLARIIASDVFAQAGITDLTGAGLSTYITDNQYPILVVDAAAGTVGVAPKPSRAERCAAPKTTKTIPFAQYIELDDDACRAFRAE